MTNKKAKAGDRVSVISADQKYFYGFGTLLENEDVDLFGGNGTEEIISTPKINLDKGDIIYGYECWWCLLSELNNDSTSKLEAVVFKREDEPMEANEYQELASRTLIDKPDFELTINEIMLVWNALGLAGEAGEVANTIKKSVFHRHGINTETIMEELGDVLWYISAICTKLNISLEDVMKNNVGKLKSRYPNGYSSEDSINREKK
jgi:NTP pyrophosphatase (non-canonical NTP hydrolase)